MAVLNFPTVGKVTSVTSEVSTCFHWELKDLNLFLRLNKETMSPPFQFGKRSLYFATLDVNYVQDSECFLWIYNENGTIFPLCNRSNKNKFNPKIELKTDGKIIPFVENVKDYSFSFVYSHIPHSTNPSTISLELFNTSESKKRLLELCDRKEKARKHFRGLSQSLKESYLNKLHCDLTIKVKEREFQVHKLMLISRSPVFAAMMEHNMTEKKSNYIDVTDCDPQAFDMFLLYMYSGEIENLSLDNVRDLYVVADKYAVYELKENCAEFMKHNLTIDVFCDVVELAEKHSDSGLLKVSRQFFSINTKNILKTKRWKSLCQYNAALSSSILTSGETKKLSLLKKK